MNPLRATPPATLALLIVNTLAFGWLILGPAAGIGRLALWPVGQGFAVWQLLSYSFLHGSVGHLAANMFGLWMFGGEVERRLGSWQFALAYFSSVLTAALVQVGVDRWVGSIGPTIGASGGVFGIMAAFALLYPRRKLALMFFPIPMPAPVFVALYAGIELFSGVEALQPGIAHFAHLGGLIGGLTVAGTVLMRRSRAPV